MIAVGLVPLDVQEVKGSLNSQPNGKVTVSNADGTVLSVQPDGSQQSRPAGTAGPYELAWAVGDKIVYCPIGVKAFVFSLSVL